MGVISVEVQFIDITFIYKLFRGGVSLYMSLCLCLFISNDDNRLIL